MTTSERDAALQRVVGGWRKANGFAPMTGEPFPSIAPTHTGKWSHNWPSLVDWIPYSKAFNLTLPPELLPPLPGETCDHLWSWLEAQAVARKLPKNSYTNGVSGLWQGSVLPWQTAVALGALCAIRDVPAAADLVPDVNKLIQHTAACIVGPGMAPDGVGPTGTVLQPNPLWDCYTARHPKRVIMGPGGNGTSTWVPNPLLCSESSCGSVLALKVRDAAKLLWGMNTYPSPPDLETTGLLPITTFGLKP